MEHRSNNCAGRQSEASFLRVKDVADNYRKMFASLKDLEIRNLESFSTENRVVDDSVARCKVIGPDFLPVPIGSQVEIRLVHIFELVLRKK